MAHMRVFKKGESRKKWHLEFQDHAGITRRLPTGINDKSSATWMGNNIDRLVAARQAGAPVPADLMNWISDGMRLQVRNKLVEWGVLDRSRVSQGQPIKPHVEAWRDYRIGSGVRPDVAGQAEYRVKKIVDACGMETFNDIDGERIVRKLDEWRRLPNRATGKISPATRDHYVVALKQFCTWMHTEGKAQEHKLKTLTKLNDERNREKVRRALSIEEQRELVATTDTGQHKWSSSAPDRSLVYELAIWTGFRADAIKQLRRDSFKLDVEQPYVAGYDKGDKHKTIPLQGGLLARLRHHLQFKAASAPAFETPYKGNMARMLQWDAEIARAAWIHKGATKQERGRRRESEFLKSPNAAGDLLDFHCLRHTCGTNLARSGKSPQFVADWIGHSDVKLTMRYYTHLVLEDRADGAVGLPEVSPVSEASKRICDSAG